MRPVLIDHVACRHTLDSQDTQLHFHRSLVYCFKTIILCCVIWTGERVSYIWSKLEMEMVLSLSLSNANVSHLTPHSDSNSHKWRARSREVDLRKAYETLGWKIIHKRGHHCALHYKHLILIPITWLHCIHLFPDNNSLPLFLSERQVRYDRFWSL